MLRSIAVHVLDLVFEQFCGNISSTEGLLCVSTIASHFQLASLFHAKEFTGPTLVIGEGCTDSMRHLQSVCIPLDDHVFLHVTSQNTILIRSDVVNSKFHDAPLANGKTVYNLQKKVWSRGFILGSSYRLE